MKKVLAFMYSVIACITCAAPVNAAVRDGNATARNNTSVRVTTQTARENSTPRTTIMRPTNDNKANNTSRSTTKQQSVVSRPSTTATKSATVRAQTTKDTQQTQTNTTTRSTVSRAATTTATAMSQTRTGAEYERCKNAYFKCMDQFCSLKNDDYRRCSCSDRVYDLAEIRSVMNDAGNQIKEFTENLDVVGMTAAQATAMRNASEGENALTDDLSASKALLQAIMNSIKGEKSTVGGKYSDLNSISISFDTTNAFGLSDTGQAIAAYNGKNLYTAVYPQCRAAVRADCNDASLQRAITAYLMAIEQDCNTVQTAIQSTQKQMKSALREGSAMLDLARVENRREHNSDDLTTCIANIESAILSEQVCGQNYHKCLDNGQFIDISTGTPIAGVTNINELATLLTFADGVDIANQKLSKVSSNRSFVAGFEAKTKKFAEPALDKCREQADVAWSEYLDKAMLAIYYAQKDKVSDIKQGCFDFVSSCYVNSNKSLTAAMKELIGDSTVVLQPDKIALSTAMCQDYIDSCSNMFGGDIVSQYIQNRDDTDVLAACRAVAQQCFDNFGGTNYENFYYPYSGTFDQGKALDWFTLYEYELVGGAPKRKDRPVSECARQLSEISSCSNEEMLRKAFGGFDKLIAGTNDFKTYYLSDTDNSAGWKNFYNGENTGAEKRYGRLTLTANNTGYELRHHVPYSPGVATEVYNQVVDVLSTQCTNAQGKFIEVHLIDMNSYAPDNFCKSTFYKKDENNNQPISLYGGVKSTPNLANTYKVGDGEDMCPKQYNLSVDIHSWGACLCWENGGRRSKWGQSAKCLAAFPTATDINDRMCSTDDAATTASQPTSKNHPFGAWCTAQKISQTSNQVCPQDGTQNGDSCSDKNGQLLYNLPNGLN